MSKAHISLQFLGMSVSVLRSKCVSQRETLLPRSGFFKLVASLRTPLLTIQTREHQLCLMRGMPGIGAGLCEICIVQIRDVPVFVLQMHRRRGQGGATAFVLPLSIHTRS